jgi:hypothetical protein
MNRTRQAKIIYREPQQATDLKAISMALRMLESSVVRAAIDDLIRRWAKEKKLVIEERPRRRKTH